MRMKIEVRERQIDLMGVTEAAAPKLIMGNSCGMSSLSCCFISCSSF
ncbi:hypothetical protein GCM10007981_01070 [Thermocladium modestius]|uniref:Uncharacterized protein n=1 Tax=Thermocladium modestius TaxID=62609 RepID=A0A830GTF8_9CREN|nr:hypothetical protein [Thermocladium modestius]GGP19031.1 hypothetical protein GCM10007981_01070 [Thermocladium modestius]